MANVHLFGQVQCVRTRRHFDAYLSNQLAAETQQEVSAHLQSCSNCSAELQDRAQLRRSLKNAVSSTPVPEGLRSRIQSQLRSTLQDQPSPTRRSRWPLAAAAVLLLGVAGFGLARLWLSERHAGNLSARRAERPASRTEVTQLLQVGLGDHIHCAAGTWYEGKVVTSQEMAGQMGEDFAGLIPLALDRLPNYRTVQGHRCKVDAREFVHMILKGQGSTVSLIVTRKQSESYPREVAARIMEAAGVRIYHDRLQEYEVAGFETHDFLAYVVSNLESAETLRIASQVARPMRDLLVALETSGDRAADGGVRFELLVLHRERLDRQLLSL
ncbi:MAG: zf-HC2 domain-containing protein [Acidobacteriota bacterium]